MSFVIYHKETTVYLNVRGRIYNPAYETLAAAKAALTRAVKKGEVKREDYDISPLEEFRKFIEKKEIRRGIAGSDGKEFEVSVNTPWTSGPWSETYWSS